MRVDDRDIRAPLDLFQRTYHSLLRSTGEIQIQALVEPNLAFDPILHQQAQTTTPDLVAHYISNILGKLGFSSRAQAAAYAVEHQMA